MKSLRDHARRIIIERGLEPEAPFPGVEDLTLVDQLESELSWFFENISIEKDINIEPSEPAFLLVFEPQES
jgi:hypothetical protein